MPFIYPMVYRSGGWCPTTPREEPPLKDGFISIPPEHPDFQRVLRLQYKKGNWNNIKGIISNTHPPKV